MRNTTRLILSAGAAIFFAVVGRATLVDQALVRFDTNVRNYNLVSLGDASFSQYGDTEGGLAVAGNLFLQGGAVANRPELFKPTGDPTLYVGCLLYTSDAADDLLCVDLGGRRIIKKKKNMHITYSTQPINTTCN